MYTLGMGSDTPEKTTLSVRVPEDMKEAVEDAAEEQEISRADALRRAIREKYLQPATDGGEVVDEVNGHIDDRLDELAERRTTAARLRLAQWVGILVGVPFIVAAATGRLSAGGIVGGGLLLLLLLGPTSIWSLRETGWL